ncbi:CBL-interacting serine/threonine-protein kinase 23 [Glycine soja]|uniref:CBL-interacting serine/threonine-protein kinase 23 n=1 Tax=Glycine soja TaxID=3848 RepID=A0A445JCM7_GLYSO|nr:hypothetical protein JHK87_020843 [Glycine soja]RZB96130.1 CBL-interacting serine/threonine-protein kinase 23 [Glycine soja]
MENEKIPSVYEHGSCSRSAEPEPRPNDSRILGRKYHLYWALGFGSSAIVKLASDVTTGHGVAIKIFDKEFIDGKKKSVKKRMKIALEREISAMTMLRSHPNVVRIIEVMATTTRVYIVMELVVGGATLLDKIGRTSGMSETQARQYFHQLICAVDYCHSRGVIHRDLNPSNLLLAADGVLKVSDFGMTALPQQARQDGLLHSACGALDYKAPEVIRNRGYEGEKADIWSCGAILFHLVAGDVPFTNILQADFICPSFFSASLVALIRRILDPNPTTRITMNEIFENEWFMENYEPPRFYRQNFTFALDMINDSNLDVNVPNLVHRIHKSVLLRCMEQGLQHHQETSFISQNPVDEIIDGIERVAGIMGFDVKRINSFRMSIEGGANARRKGHLAIFIKISEIAQPFHMVELRKAEGDVLEFHNFCKHIYAALSDFIWKGRAEPIDTETDG